MTSSILRQAEIVAAGEDIDLMLSELRKLCLDDFGELLLTMPDKNLPHLSRLLPKMPSAEVQKDWTGNDGYALLRQSLNFCRMVNFDFREISGRSLKNARILDFGIGYGRIARLMLYYTSPSKLYGVDPWDQAIALCNQCNVLGRLALSDYLPTRLPFEKVEFDLIYAFSVFTHLSLKAARYAFGTLREYISGKGVLVITIRPEEYWLTYQVQTTGHTIEKALQEHRERGFAFVPHNRVPIDGDVTYGETSMTLEFLEKEFPGWKIEMYDRTLDDPYQVVVFLTPALKPVKKGPSISSN